MKPKAHEAYDAILIPGGGIQPSGEPTKWVLARLDQAIECFNRSPTSFIITTSGGSVHKPPPVDVKGFPIFESVAYARYLMTRGVPCKRILFETSSYDTIGNAYFSRQIHVDPMRLKRLLIITSQFHMARTRPIFQWVYGIEPDQRYMLSFLTVSNDGMDEAVLAVRRSRERDSLRQLRSVASTLTTLSALHDWLFGVHSAYTLANDVHQTSRIPSFLTTASTMGISRRRIPTGSLLPPMRSRGQLEADQTRGPTTTLLSVDMAAR